MFITVTELVITVSVFFIFGFFVGVGIMLVM